MVAVGKNDEFFKGKMCNPAQRTSGTLHEKRPCRWNACQCNTAADADTPRDPPDSDVVDDPSNGLFPGADRESMRE